MKNAFYYMLKALVVVEIFTIVSRRFTYVEKWLDNKAMVNFKMYCISKTVPNILRSKGNPAIKFGQLIKQNIKNIFLEKLYSKCDRETSFWTYLLKIKIEHISGITV